jgi:hypothetical protein
MASNPVVELVAAFALFSAISKVRSKKRLVEPIYRQTRNHAWVSFDNRLRESFVQNRTYVIYGKDLAGTGLLYVRHVPADASNYRPNPMLHICVAKSAMLNAGFTEEAAGMAPFDKLHGTKNAWTVGFPYSGEDIKIFVDKLNGRYALDIYVESTKAPSLLISLQQQFDNYVNRLDWQLDLSSASSNRATLRYENERPAAVLPSDILDQLTSR